VSKGRHDVESTEEPLIPTSIETGILQGVGHVPFSFFFLALGVIPILYYFVIGCLLNNMFFGALSVNCISSEESSNRQVCEQNKVDDHDNGNFEFFESLLF
jgi:hypothetical protein|tara:strand:+ start:388 stop:690 length:303 start_codon:yes stop_codon:yes gene_type:complete